MRSGVLPEHALVGMAFAAHVARGSLDQALSQPREAGGNVCVLQVRALFVCTELGGDQPGYSWGPLAWTSRLSC